MITFELIDEQPKLSIGSVLLHKHKLNIDDVVGDIKYFADEGNPMALREQFDKNYSFGGGWNPMTGFVMDEDNKSITYPEDPPLLPIAKASFRDQEIYVYPYAWVAIVEKDGTFEVSRMD